jgi:hypothetical protein
MSYTYQCSNSASLQPADVTHRLRVCKTCATNIRHHAGTCTREIYIKLHGVTSSNTVHFIVTAVRTQNLACKTLAGKPEGQRYHGIPRRRSEDNIKMDTQYSSRGVKLITYLNLEPRLRMNGAIPSFPQVLTATCLIKQKVNCTLCTYLLPLQEWLQDAPSAALGVTHPARSHAIKHHHRHKEYKEVLSVLQINMCILFFPSVLSTTQLYFVLCLANQHVHLVFSFCLEYNTVIFRYQSCKDHSHLHHIWNLSSYPTVNTVHLHWKYQTVNAVCVNSRLLWESHEVQTLSDPFSHVSSTSTHFDYVHL